MPADRAFGFGSLQSDPAAGQVMFFRIASGQLHGVISMRALLLSTLVALGVSFSALAQTAGVTATCRDGTAWSGASRRGACSGHQGVQAFGAASAAAASAASPSTSAVAPATTPPPAVAPAPTATVPVVSPPRSSSGPGQVWVNTRSKVYHCQGDRYYGKTAQGEYMTEVAAKAAGDRPSRGKACS